MKRPPQFDLPLPTEPMRLVGETVRQSDPPKRELPNDTREFPGLRGMFYIHEQPKAKP